MSWAGVEEYSRYVDAQLNLIRVCEKACRDLMRIARKLERDELKHQRRLCRKRP